MGKRRERRKAAQSNAGRRVKLDLFAEPSGDLGGSSGQDEVEGDVDSTHHDGLPNSASSSGQQRENSLLLLGQYSDDETEEEPRRSSNAPGESSVAHNDQVETSTSKQSEDTGANTIEELDSEKMREEVGRDSTSLHDLLKLEESDVKESEVSASHDLPKEIEAGEHIHVAGTFDAQVVGDVSSGWKIVMHEETNQYYYWNIDTGETSWEVPEVLSQMTNSAGDTYKASAEMAHNPGHDSHESDPSSTMTVGKDGDCAFFEDNGAGSEDALLHSQSQKLDEYRSRKDEMTEEQNLENLDDAYCRDDIHKAGSKECTLGTDNWTYLIKKSECLLEKLKSLESSNELHFVHERILKYVIEVETRLSDMKSLSSYGVALHPFWVHSERQLEHLELAIDEVKPMLNDEVKETSDGKLEKNVKLEFKEDRNEYEEGFLTSQTAASFPNDASTTAEPSAVNHDHATNDEHLASQSQIGQLGGGTEDGELVNSGFISDGPIVTASVDAGEDVDMDVDMEVEDVGPVSTAITGMIGVESTVVPEKSSVLDPTPEPSSVTSEDQYFIPPPPDEEFIPPPPPDAEQIPPPPPDEPPEPSYAPPAPYTEVEQPSSYTEQYPLTYANTNYEYYGQNGVPNSNFYGHAEGSQVVLPHGSVSYVALPSTTASIIVTPVESVAYYSTQDGAVPAVPGVGIVNTSQFESQFNSLNYSYITTTDELGSVYALAETSSGSIPLSGVASSVVGSRSENETSHVPSTSSAIETSATTSEKNNIPAPSISTAAASAATVAPSAISKVQSKVLRSKKRTVAVAPSLRSNKKVSSLVDKWKAAKEELQGDDEDEAKTALALLEKKRQREIEEWHAQQIASGEAKVNANFQPLGGDWRERVKRKRAQAASEAVQNQEQLNTGNQQPDLVELSRSLPSGWQAYWDESSKQVYYGNLVTSETTWTKPTK
ncbi:uncharacterized protein LOC115726122 isoform X3 [Rhodamnia argentea]|uniref:Uncharacterized protein LOC115726122 isoform X3 n=1 Tax=Rhodamnia argentea TaxID=178133 RepID=A0A8B8MLI6_9MYRT|nr:uncharacterized protein LOC115726122 isoform X3 [Rhodamnia argentea]